MLANLRISSRILLGCTIPFLFMAVFLAVIYWAADRIEREESLGDRSDAALMQLYKLQMAYDDIAETLSGYVMGEKVDIAKIDQEFNRQVRDISKPLANLMDTTEERELLRNLVDTGQKLDAALDRVVEAFRTGKRGDAIKVFLASSVPNISRDVKTLTSELESMKAAETRDHKSKSRHALLILRATIIGSMILVALLAVAVSIWISRRINRNLTEAVSAMSSISAEIAATVEEHERVASQQAAMVSQTSTTMEELGASSRQSAEQSEASVEAAQKASMLVTEGNRLVTRTLEAMDDLKGKVGAVAERILRLGEQTGQIGTIAEILKELATQINMLALNAAVEAARAGEHGKGFAVVASEVRKLAVESKKSAEQAKTIVTDIQAATSSTVISTEEGTQKTEEVTRCARKLGEFFEGLSEAADVGYDNAQQMLLNAKQQSTAINQVVTATNSINAGARETAAGITQTREGLQRLNEAARTLQVMV